jgi:DNA repair protein RecO (recombination protein O)
MTHSTLGLVIRVSDWSETSRLATIWTRDFGKVRVLAKGGRRLKSNFEIALDLLNLCRIVLIRKTPGALDLLTEAQVADPFPELRRQMPTLYAGYYVAELLGEGTLDDDPHPRVLDEAVAALRDFANAGTRLGLRVARFELAVLTELGYRPRMTECVDCGVRVDESQSLYFHPLSGGMICPVCRERRRGGCYLTSHVWHRLRQLMDEPQAWNEGPTESREVRKVIESYIAHWLGRRLRLFPYLAQLP